MSNKQTVTVPLWKEGRNGNIQFLSNFKRLEIENPSLYALIKQQEGFQTEDGEYQYKIGVSKYGMWLSRKEIEDRLIYSSVVYDLPKKTAAENTPTKNELHYQS